MRTIVSVLFFFCYINLSGQYVTGIANDSLDAQFVSLTKLIDNRENEDALKLCESLLKVWEKKCHETAESSISMNYYDLLIKKNRLLTRLDRIKIDSVNHILSVEKELKSRFPNNKTILAMQYQVVAYVHSKMYKDEAAKIDFLKKSLALYKLDSEKNKKVITQISQSLGTTFRIQRKFDLSKSYLHEALELAKTFDEPDTSLYISILYSLGANAYYTKSFEDGFKYANQAAPLAEKYFDKDNITLIHVNRLLGVMYKEIGEIKKSLAYELKCLESMKLRPEGKTKGIARYYSSVSESYKMFGKIKECLIYADSAILYAKRDNEYGLLAGYYHNKALIIPDSEEAFKLFNKALELCQQEENCHENSYSLMLQNLGSEYNTNGYPYQALAHFTQAKARNEKNLKTAEHQLYANYSGLASINYDFGKIGLAIMYQEKAIEIIKKYRRNNSTYVAGELARLGRIYIAGDRLEEAKKVLIEALSILELKLGSSNYEATIANRFLAQIYEKEKKYSKAIFHLHKSLNGAKQYGDPYYIQLQKLSEIHYDLGNIDSSCFYLDKLLERTGMGEKGVIKPSTSIETDNLHKAFYGFYNYLIIEEKIKGNEQLQIIEKIRAGIMMLDQLKSQYFFEASESDFQQNSRAFFDWAINQQSKLYAAQPSDETLSLIFECLERSKSISINRNYKRHHSDWEGKVPEAVITKEKRIQQDYNISLDRYKKSSDESDSIKMVSAERIFQLEQERDSFLLELASKYPEYFEERYNQALCSIKDIQALARKEDKGIIVMHWSDSLVHRFLFTPKDTYYKSINTQLLEKEIDLANSVLLGDGNSSIEKNYQVNKDTFIQSSTAIYDHLFRQENIDSLPFELIIIPDGKLVKFPFEILLNKAVDRELNYKQLPYLIKHHVIQYIGSATQIHISNKFTHQRNEKLYAGFGPLYDSIPSKINEFGVYRSDVKPLMYNIEEVKNAASVLGGDEFIAADATKSNFIKQAGKYRILHLAMHTSLNDDYPLESYLNFTQDTSTNENGNLYIYEIAKINLNSELVVLSACETNNGVRTLGEGILGIAKAFSLASCNNLILSNWLVDDRSSSEIVSEFFRQLEKTDAPAVALRESKLKFIENSSTIHSHPKYWAAFSYYGEPNKFNFQTPSKNKPYRFVGYALLLLLSFLIIKKVTSL